MKKSLKYGLILLFIMAFLTTGCKKINKKNETTIDDKIVTNETKTNQGNLKFSDIKIEKKVLQVILLEL